MKETIFDGMQGWTHEASRSGLQCALLTYLTGGPEFSTTVDESITNQLFTFMVRDLERAKR